MVDVAVALKGNTRLLVKLLFDIGADVKVQFYWQFLNALVLASGDTFEKIEKCYFVRIAFTYIPHWLEPWPAISDICLGLRTVPVLSVAKEVAALPADRSHWPRSTALALQGKVDLLIDD